MIRHALGDTHALMERVLINGYQAMSPVQKLERVRAMTEAIERLAMADIRRRHPDADDREHALRLASRRIPPDLMRRAFGWDVKAQGY